MTFFSLQQHKKTLTIRNKKRISLIVPYCSAQIIIFYQDCSYEHRQLFDSTILKQGKLPFVVTQVIRPLQVGVENNEEKQNIDRKNEYVCVIGHNHDNSSITFGILNIRSKLYLPYEQTFFQTKKQSQSTNFHLLSQTSSGYPLLVMISLNCESGIMIQCFDFYTGEWINDMLYLGSRFLSYHMVGVPVIVGHEMKEKSVRFCLLANGQKSESVHVACVGVVQEEESKKSIFLEDHSFKKDQSILQQKNTINQSSSITPSLHSKKMHFTFTKQIKLYRNFTTLGGHITQDGNLFLIGNSLTFQTKEKKSSQCQSITCHMSFTNLINNIDPQFKFVDLKNIKLGREVIVREYLGCVDGSLVFVVQNFSKRGIHKISPKMILSKQQHYDEQLHVFSSSSRHQQILLSHDLNAIVNYELVCEQFFQKIKDSPSVIRVNLLMKVGKRMYYKQMIEGVFGYARNDEGFVRSVLGCL